ncbi:MAG TPA: hypothetical protein VK536_04000 [Candidatus Limnocylindrales bacterium]|nr:hypothetical protein [Candidatus Limnocylindrales bacterium]
MKLVNGWKRISNKRGFVNEVTGQTLVIEKQEFGEHYHVLLSEQERTDDGQGNKISPEYSSEAKAEAFAIDWMKKNPNGATK